MNRLRHHHLGALLLAMASVHSAVHADCYAAEHVPGPGGGSSPGDMLGSSGSDRRTMRQRDSRTTYRSIRRSSVEDPAYLGHSIPLDLASVGRLEGGGLGLHITLWQAPEQLPPESLVVFFARRGAFAPSWAAYQAAATDGGEPQPWALYAWNPTTGLYDKRIADAELQVRGTALTVTVQRAAELPWRPLAFAETRSPDDSDMPWTDSAPTQKRGVRVR